MNSRRYTIATHVIARTVGDETVLLDLNQQEYLALDAVGSVVWAGLTEGRSLDEVVDDIVEQFDADRATVEADVVAFIDELAAAALVVTE